MKNLIRENYGTPLLIISHRSLNIEKPSDFANKIADDALKKKLDAGITKLTTNAAEEEQSTHKHRKAKGPNPLSCKKKTNKKKPVKRLDNKILK